MLESRKRHVRCCAGLLRRRLVPARFTPISESMPSAPSPSHAPPNKNTPSSQGSAPIKGRAACLADEGAWIAPRLSDFSWPRAKTYLVHEAARACAVAGRKERRRKGVPEAEAAQQEGKAHGSEATAILSLRVKAAQEHPPPVKHNMNILAHKNPCRTRRSRRPGVSS